MARKISRGEIFWGRVNEPNNSHMKHPIVVMEDVDFSKTLPDKIATVVLSTKGIKDSVAENIEMSRDHFEWMSSKKRPYKIKVNRRRKEYLICYGFLKCPSALHIHEKGKLTSCGLEFVEKTLKEHNITKYEYVPYTIKEYDDLMKSQKRKDKKSYSR